MAAWPASINKKQTSGAYWEEEVVQLMMGRPFHHLDVIHRPSPNTSSSSPSIPNNAGAAYCATLDLLGASFSSEPCPLREDRLEGSGSPSSFDLDADAPLPSGWEKCLDLQTGSIYYLNRSTGMRTSFDQRKTSTSSTTWPASPSSSSDLTVEANASMAASTKPSSAISFLQAPTSKEPTNLDLTLSLKPSSPCSRPHSLNHSLNREPSGDFTHKLKSLISPQTKQFSSQAPLSKPSFFSSLPFNSTKPSYASPSCAALAASSSSCMVPSAHFFKELSAFRDMETLPTSEQMSCKENKPVNMKGSSKHISNNASMNGRRRADFSREAFASSPSLRTANAMTDAQSDVSSPMMTAGCANCLMFVMLPISRSPKCPRCGAFIDADLPQLQTSFKKPKLGLSVLS